MEDEDAIQELEKDEYHEEEPNIISEELDDEFEEGDDLTIS